MADRIEGLDKDHILLVIHQIATLHALSWCFKEIEGLDKLSSSYPLLIDTMYGEFFENSFKPVMDSVIASTLTVLEEELGSSDPVYKGIKKLCSYDVFEMLNEFSSPKGVNEREMENKLRVRDSTTKNFLDGR